MATLTPQERIDQQLQFIYGDERALQVSSALQDRLDAFKQQYPQLSQDIPNPQNLLTEKDAILIAYGDQFQQAGEHPLATLQTFLSNDLAGALNGVHILPFYPYSSDDGFSVIDYKAVDPNLGDWQDVAALKGEFRLMFDAVINHISRESGWFQGFLEGKEPYTDYFITVDPAADLSQVVRPRALPLLTPVDTANGTQHVWTTFSDDQIDLNYASPDLMLAMIDVLLFYVAQGAEIIRLDAIAYLWKEIGTSCIHLPETHAVVKLWRAVLDEVAPGVILITETNVPHEDNISYFGDPLPGSEQTDEAQMVYQFPLAPLVLHTFHTADASVLSEWAAGLEPPTAATTFFNFIASHDGIGVMPAKGLLREAEIQALVERTTAHGGEVSYKTNSDGSQSVYELNVTLYDYLNDSQSPDDLDVARFLASQAIMLSLAGVPGIYVHSLFGSRNCQACFAETGRARSLNREKFDYPQLVERLADETDHAAQVFAGYKHLLHIRQQRPAFHPNGGQRILQLDPRVFATLRTAPAGEETVLCLVNVSPEAVPVALDLTALELDGGGQVVDCLGGEEYAAEGPHLKLTLEPYQCKWLQK